jgi:hypothetical protein
MTTLSSYLMVANNLSTWQTVTQAQPSVKQATAYYNANIGNVQSASDLVNNYRLFSYAMTAFGLGDMVSYGKGLMQKVLEQGTSSTSNLAYTLNNPNILAFAQAFNFALNGSSTTSTAAATTGVVNKYVNQELDANQGQQNPAVQMALYFQQNAPDITSAYSILADKDLLTVVQTALGISPQTSMEDVDTQASQLSSAVNIADFKNPQKLQQFVEKYCAMSDASAPASDLTATLFSPSDDSMGISTTLMSSIQNLPLGGF